MTDDYDGAPLYWSRERGCWVLHQFATEFSSTEQATFKVPEDGYWEWTKWAQRPNEYWEN